MRQTCQVYDILRAYIGIYDQCQKWFNVFRVPERPIDTQRTVVYDIYIYWLFQTYAARIKSHAAIQNDNNWIHHHQGSVNFWYHLLLRKPGLSCSPGAITDSPKYISVKSKRLQIHQLKSVHLILIIAKYNIKIYTTLHGSFPYNLCETSFITVRGVLCCTMGGGGRCSILYESITTAVILNEYAALTYCGREKTSHAVLSNTVSLTKYPVVNGSSKA